MPTPSAIQQAGSGAVTIGYWLQYAVAPAVIAFLPILKVKLWAFFDDTHAIRGLLEEALKKENNK